MKIFRNIIAVVFGVFIGGFVNMVIVTYGGSFVPLPEGVDPNNIESIKENMHLYKPIQFAIPFLAHAIGTFVGAFLASIISVTHQRLFSLSIGCFFLLGGITMVSLLPSPLWFNILDLGFAYIPMAWLGWKISGKKI
jgi:hypothetical protein